MAQFHEPQSAASIPRRMLAAALDGLVLALAVQAVHWSLAFAVGRPDEWLGSALAWHAYLFVMVTLPCWIYYASSESSRWSATLAKRWLGLRVVHVYGARIGPLRSFVRSGLKLLPWEVAHFALCFPQPVFVTQHLGMPRLLFVSYALLGLYLASALMTLKKQSVHDLVAGTYVVQDPRSV